MFRGRLPFQLLPLRQLLVVNQRHLCDHGHHCDDTYIIFIFTIVIEKNVVAGVMTVKSAKRKLLQRQVVVNPRLITIVMINMIMIKSTACGGCHESE